MSLKRYFKITNPFLLVIAIIVVVIIGAILYARARINRNNLDYIVKQEYYGKRITCDSIIDLSNLMSFEWETLYYYSGACDLSEIYLDFGYEPYMDSETSSEKIIFCNNGKIVHFQTWTPDFDYAYEQKITGVIFSTSDNRKFKVSKDSAKFKVSVKNGEIFYLTPINPILF